MQRSARSAPRADVIPAGFIYKQPTSTPAWVGASAGTPLHSLSGCIAEYFAEYIPHWKHNGYWLFDHPAALDAVAAACGVDPLGLDLLYFEYHPSQYRENAACWEPFEAEGSLSTDVVPPGGAPLLGYEVVCFSCGTSPECAPAVCCGLAPRLQLNQFLLFPTLESAVSALESGAFDDSEPGPFRIAAVHLVRAAAR